MLDAGGRQEVRRVNQAVHIRKDQYAERQDQVQRQGEKGVV